MINLFLLLGYFSFFNLEVNANETCSRIALIGKEKVLVDPNLTLKGNGLRPYLEKSPLSIKYLNEYQYTKKKQLGEAFIGTVGTGLILGGLISEASQKSKNNLIIAGISTWVFNLLFSKIANINNEKYLNKAIKEYNNKNSPRILLKRTLPSEDEYRIFLNKKWNY